MPYMCYMNKLLHVQQRSTNANMDITSEFTVFNQVTRSTIFDNNANNKDDDNTA